MPFDLNHDRRRLSRQRRKIVNWRDCDASLRQRGSPTVWFTAEAIEGWRAAPRATAGGQVWYSPPAILTALTLRAVFPLALRWTEGPIGSVIGLLGLALRVPDHSTSSGRATTLEVPRPTRSGSGAGADGESEPMHLLVDCTGLKLCGAGERPIEKHGTRVRRSWKELHLGLDADTGQIVAAAPTDRDVDDASRVGSLLDQVTGTGAAASLTADGAYDRGGTCDRVAERDPDAAVIVPPRATAVPNETAQSAPTRRDRHLRCIAGHGRMGWRKASGYNTPASAGGALASIVGALAAALRRGGPMTAEAEAPSAPGLADAAAAWSGRARPLWGRVIAAVQGVADAPGGEGAAHPTPAAPGSPPRPCDRAPPRAAGLLPGGYAPRPAMPRHALAAVLFACSAHAAPPPDADPSLAPWFRDLRVPGTGGSCCSLSDCRPVEARTKGDRYEALIEGRWLAVPPEKVLPRSDNPTGRAVVCWTPALGIICFVHGPEA